MEAKIKEINRLPVECKIKLLFLLHISCLETRWILLTREMYLIRQMWKKKWIKNVFKEVWRKNEWCTEFSLVKTLIINYNSVSPWLNLISSDNIGKQMFDRVTGKENSARWKSENSSQLMTTNKWIFSRNFSCYTLVSTAIHINIYIYILNLGALRLFRTIHFLLICFAHIMQWFSFHWKWWPYAFVS